MTNSNNARCPIVGFSIITLKCTRKIAHDKLTIRAFLLMVNAMDTSNSDTTENKNEQNAPVNQPPASNTPEAPVVMPGVTPTVSAPAESASAPAVENPAQPASGAATNDRPKMKLPLAAVLVGVLCLALGAGGGYVLAASLHKKDSAGINPKVATPNVENKELVVPEGATVISECAKGRGKQYVLPKDIPQGPVYNVYNGKVTSIEYMLGQEDVLRNKDYLNLPLENVRYDHINIGLLSKGHSGFPEPHYHVDVFTITHEEALKITCE